MCTRIIYETESGKYITGRGMDWNDPNAPTSVFVYPRGLKQVGSNESNAITWVSKYGSIFSSFYGAASVDGINERGFVANALYLAEAEYGDINLSNKARLSIGAWTQYFLDNFATVQEAVDAMQAPAFIVNAPLLPNGRAATAHLSISDVHGDSAILEYINGELIIHHDSQHKVMTNSPVFDEQLAINKYWKLVGGNRMLPGTINSADRFVRTNYLLESTPKFADGEEANAAALSIMRSVGVPLGMADPDHPNISATLWRTIADHEAKRFYFESCTQPTIFWLDIDKVNLNEGAPIMSVEVDGPDFLAGDVTKQLQESTQLTWM